MVMAAESGWRGVMIAPPNPLAGIGGALRHAFAMDAAGRSAHLFADLLARLDQPFDRSRGR